MTWPCILGGLIAGALTVSLIPTEHFFISHEVPALSAAGAERWACPMMDFIGTHPGACPVCGMELHLVTAGELTREQVRRMGVELADVEQGPAVVTVRAYGLVRYDERTARLVIPRIGGRIVKRHPGTLHPGMPVRVDEPLVDLYSPEVFAAQGELAAAVRLKDVELQQAIRERFVRWNLGPLADAVLAGAPLTDTVTIRSPFAGRVVAASSATDLPQVGQEITADNVLVRLLDPAEFIVMVEVPEARTRFLREGQRVELASDDGGSLHEIDARIEWLAPEMTTEIRSRTVHIHLNDPYDRVRPGSLISATFHAALGPDLKPADPDRPATWGSFTLVPKAAVLSTGVRDVAWKLVRIKDDGAQRFALAPLDLGPRLEGADGRDRYIVRSGLEPGDHVAAQGAFLIDAQAQLAGSPSLLFPLGAASAPAHQH
jgi:Cu(I)/Ag(I) efflux system membrane fusion protein